MSDQDAHPAPEGPNSQRLSSAEPQQPDVDNSVRRFIFQISKLFPIEMINAALRATPHGLFVAEDSHRDVTIRYQSWLAESTGGAVTKSEAKCMKRLFGTTEPDRSYIIEGKQCLVGALISCELPEPQRVGIPYFLGSLTRMKDYIHPKDPVLAALSGLEMTPVSEGMDFSFSQRGRKVVVSTPVLEEFVAMARRSSQIIRHHPKIADSMAEGLKALVKMLEVAKPVKRDAAVLVPARFRTLRRDLIGVVGGAHFIFDQRSRLVASFETRGANLLRFVQREFAAMQPKRIGCFEVFRVGQRELGSFQFGKERHLLSMRTFLQFLEALRFTPDKREQFTESFTVRDLFDRFSELYQRARPISRSEILGHVTHLKRKVKEFRITGPWIFVLSPQGVIEACIAKHVRAPERPAPRRHRRRPRR